MTGFALHGSPVPEDLLESFLDALRADDAALGASVARLDPRAGRELTGLLRRFDAAGKGALRRAEARRAARVLRRLHDLDADSLALANQILDYLDVTGDGRLAPRDLELCIEVLEVFAAAESPDGRLTARQLHVLHAVLRHFDHDDNARLENAELRWLRHELANPPAFMARLRSESPQVRRVLES